MTTQVLTRIRRIVKLIGLLQGSQGYNAPALARACEVSTRTVFRYLEDLREAEVPLVYDDERKTYRIPGQFFLPPTNFTADEAIAMLVLCHELGDQHKLPLFAAARSAAAKLETSLPRRLLDYLRNLSGALSIKLDATNPLDGQQGTYAQLVEAIGQRQSVRISYRSLHESESIKTKLEPYQLLFNQHSWYVIGRSSMHREVRTFNVGRIDSLEELKTPYEVPKQFSLQRYLGNAWRLIPEPGDDHEVHLRFSPRVAKNVAEVIWHRTQNVSFADDGWLDFRVTVSGLTEISWWVMGYGDQVQVVAPTELRDVICRRATNMLTLYNGDSPAAP